MRVHAEFPEAKFGGGREAISEGIEKMMSRGVGATPVHEHREPPARGVVPTASPRESLGFEMKQATMPDVPGSYQGTSKLHRPCHLRHRQIHQSQHER